MGHGVPVLAGDRPGEDVARPVVLGGHIEGGQGEIVQLQRHVQLAGLDGREAKLELLDDARARDHDLGLVDQLQAEDDRADAQKRVGLGDRGVGRGGRGVGVGNADRGADVGGVEGVDAGRGVDGIDARAGGGG
ncbi:MAG: hypothetical protein D0528_00520, partial [Methylococcales bacterium]